MTLTNPALYDPSSPNNAISFGAAILKGLRRAAEGLVEGLRGSGDNVRDITSWEEAVGVMEGLRIKSDGQGWKGKR